MKKKGNVFLIIIGILSVIFILATFFIKTTIEEKHQTEFSHRAVQVQCLAEAALERAISILSTKLNDYQECTNPNSLANIIRRPYKLLANSNYGSSANLGINSPLDLTDTNSYVYTLKKDDLQVSDNKELDELVNFMSGGNCNYEVEVRVKINKAFKNAPGPSVGGEKYKVPGVQIPWNCHPAVLDFLNNQGFVALTLALPDSIRWLSVPLKFEFAGIKVFSINLISIISEFAKTTNNAALNEFLRCISLHAMFSKLFPDIYPYTIKFDKNIFPPINNKLAGVSISNNYDSELIFEKFGYLEFESKASITFSDGRKITKTITALKEFKCADIEPIAPMYSFFIANFHDEQLIFNDVGGNLYVNNFAEHKSIVDNSVAPEKKEFPGLVRINGTKPMVVNVGFIGNPFSPDIDENDNLLKKLGRGANWLLIMDHEISKTFKEFKTTISYKSELAKYTSTVTSLPKEAQGSPSGTNAAASSNSGSSSNNPQTSPEDKPVTNQDANKDQNKMLQLLQGFADKVNFIPPLGDFGITIYEAPLHVLANVSNYVRDPFSAWDWPMMGVGYRLFRIPFPTPSSTVTHLFGSAALFPTLTRQIEGFVLKQYRQWHFAIISWPPAPLPLGKQVPIPWPPNLLLPIPLPIWHTHDIQNKYDYNLYLLKLPKKDGYYDKKVYTYDPNILENAPPNLYSLEQYAKKATYYYLTAQDFYKDIPNRLIKENGKDCLKLSGITYVVESITLPPPNFNKLYVSGRGAIVTGGNIILRGNIEDAYSDQEERQPNTPRTIFSLIARNGGIIYDVDGPPYIKIEGSVFTDKGIAVPHNKALKIVGNWVTNAFNKFHSAGDIMIVYTAYKTRSSLSSIHPYTGRYDPERYYISLGPGWESWKVQ